MDGIGWREVQRERAMGRETGREAERDRGETEGGTEGETEGEKESVKGRDPFSGIGTAILVSTLVDGSGAQIGLPTGAAPGSCSGGPLRTLVPAGSCFWGGSCSVGQPGRVIGFSR